MLDVARVASLLWFVVIIALSIKAIARAIAKECPKCFREVRKSQPTCFACGAAISGRNDLEEYVNKSRARRGMEIGDASETTGRKTTATKSSQAVWDKRRREGLRS
jgi:hypothetical protein